MKHGEDEKKAQLQAALAKQITIEMAELDMSQAQLAKAVGISRGAMNRYLRNHATLDFGQIIEIAGVFGLEASELLNLAEARVR